MIVDQYGKVISHSDIYSSMLLKLIANELLNSLKPLKFPPIIYDYTGRPTFSKKGNDTITIRKPNRFNKCADNLNRS